MTHNASIKKGDWGFYYMKKQPRNNGLKIVAATGMSIFTLFTVFCATYAWFSMNISSKTEGNRISVEPASGKFYKLSIHNAVSISDTQFGFDANPWGTIQIENWRTRRLITNYSSDSFFMGSYDYLEKMHPVLFLFQFGDDGVENYTASADEPISIKASTNIDYYVGDNAAGRTLYPIDEIDVSQGHFNPLSSVVKYSSRVFASAEDLDDIKTENNMIGGVTYDTYDFSTEDLSGEGSFVAFDEQDLYDSFEQEPVLYSTTSATVKYVAVVFDYYELAMETIYGAFLGDEVLSDTLSFTCDWTLVI